MKYIFITLVAATVVSWYPTYDLFIKKEFFDEHQTLVQAGFLTTVGCHDAANQMKAKYYLCEPKAQWRRWISPDSSIENKKNINNESDLPLY